MCPSLADQGLVLVRMCQADIDKLTCIAHDAGSTTYCTEFNLPVADVKVATSCGTTITCTGTTPLLMEFLVDCPTCTTCPICNDVNPQLKTYSKGGFAGSGAPNLYLLSNFGSAFPGGVFVGSPIPTVSGFFNRWSIASTVASYAGTSGTPGFLSSSTTNTLNNGTGTFGSNLLALILSIGFDANDSAFAASTKVPLGNMLLNFPTSPLNMFNGLTLSHFIVGCNYRIGAVSPLLVPAYLSSFMTTSAATLNSICASVIANYDNATVNLGNLKCY
jgi:hypothetical protein